MNIKKHMWLIFLMLAPFQILQATSIKLDSTFSTDSEIFPFEKGLTISSLSISGKVTLENELSLIRIILTDMNESEHLVYEAYFNILDSLNVNFVDESIETEFLNNISPRSLKIQVTLGHLKLNHIKVSTDYSELKFSEMELNRNTKLREINQNRITSINMNIGRKELKWFAGETSISNLSYAEKRELFGGEKFNTYGFEYYKGGLFLIPDSTRIALNAEKNTEEIEADEETLNIETESKTQDGDSGSNIISSPKSSLSGTPLPGNIVPDFTWTDRHGIDWLTPVRDQYGGTCWAHSAVAAVEAVTNSYFNDKIDLDLSENDVVFCNFPYYGCTQGSFPNIALEMIKMYGVVDQVCYPNDCNKDCGYKCDPPTEKIFINNYEVLYTISDEYTLKSALVNYGVLASRIEAWGHALALVGFGTVKANDTFFSGNTGVLDPITIPQGDSRIGETYWIFKNSWGTDWGDNGYFYVLANFSQMDETCEIRGQIESLNLDDSDINCLDNDGDGYYNWGIGNKPIHCPPCPEEPDGNDVDPNIGPASKYGDFSINLPYYYGFEDGIGDWHQSSDDDIDWIRQSGSTTSGGTGPSSAYEGSYYMYVEASTPNYPNKTSILVGPGLNLTANCNADFNFNYHMYGSTMGSLELQICEFNTSSGESWSAIWSISGDQGNSWKSSTVSLSAYTGKVIKIRFVATTGSSFTSDIAIDNISVTESLSGTQTITNTQSWSGHQSLCGHLTIENGGNLTIAGNVIMPYSANVTVNSGSELIIDGGKLVNSNITINSGGKLTIKNGGTIVINNDEITINTGGLFDLLYGEVQKFSK